VSSGTARIAVIVALVVAGVAVLANGFGDAATTVAAPSGASSTSPSSPSPTTASESASPTETPKPKVEGVTVMVFNGTDVTGLASQGQQTLTDAGYSAPFDPTNSPVGGMAETAVYYRAGPDAAQHRSNAQRIADKFFKGATVDPLGVDFQDVVDKTVQVVVVLGEDYAARVA
jgi:hypothetical protein